MVLDCALGGRLFRVGFAAPPPAAAPGGGGEEEAEGDTRATLIVTMMSCGHLDQP